MVETQKKMYARTINTILLFEYFYTWSEKKEKKI